MDPERDYAAVLRRLTRRGAAWVIAGAVGALVFVVFVIGTAYSVLDPGYRFDDGELAADFGVLAGSGALAGFAVFRIRAGDRRTGDVLTRTGTGSWLPPVVPLDDEERFAAETRRLRGLGVRAAGIALLWVGVLAAATTGLTLVDDAAERLLATGARTAGEVVSVHDTRHGSGASSMQVRYAAGGVSRTAEIVRDTERAYVVGEAVTVVYDRADPAYVRTVEEPNDDQGLLGVLVVPMLLACVAVPWSLVAAAGWWRRYRAVRHTGWRVAEVRVVPDYPVRKGRHLPDLHVRYGDDSRVVLRAVASTHGATGFQGRRDREAWVGGWGRAMVVLFPDAPLRKRPLAVPARAISPRRRPPSA